MKNGATSFLFSTAFSIITLVQASAAPVVFTINQSQSQVSVSGTVAGATFSAQGTGALTTSYNGSINADVSGSTIQFTGGSAIAAQNSGDWQPDEDSLPEAAPANYGPKATVKIGGFLSTTVYGALRNIELDLTSPDLNLTSGNFDGNSLIFSFATDAAVLDYYSNLAGSGSIVLEGYSTNTLVGEATLSNAGGVQTLTIPIDAQFVFKVLSDGDTVVHLTGQIVATSSVSDTTAPIIHSLSFSGQNIKLTVENAAGGSQVQVSADLIHWSPASFTTTTEGDTTTYTTPLAGSEAFYRIQQ